LYATSFQEFKLFFKKADKNLLPKLMKKINISSITFTTFFLKIAEKSQRSY